MAALGLGAGRETFRVGVGGAVYHRDGAGVYRGGAVCELPDDRRGWGGDYGIEGVYCDLDR